jgi:hypothetical protein
MVLRLTRTYFPEGTNGKLECEGGFICYTIELPWRNNERGISCIPEGKYFIEKRYSPKFQWHLHVRGVPNRSLILFHPANDALRELNGCLAPVSALVGPGKGIASRKAFEILKACVFAALENKSVVELQIESVNGMLT